VSTLRVVRVDRNLPALHITVVGFGVPEREHHHRLPVTFRVACEYVLLNPLPEHLAFSEALSSLRRSDLRPEVPRKTDARVSRSELRDGILQVARTISTAAMGSHRPLCQTSADIPV